MSYMAVKHLHLAAVGIGLALLLLRGFWMSIDSPMVQRKWFRMFTHINYAALLAAGVWLTFLLHIQPGEHPWLATKIAGFIALVAIGAFVMPRLSGNGARMAAWAVALAIFSYIISVALTKSVLPWMPA